KIEKYSTDAGNVEWGGNMALLFVSNSLQFNQILKPFSAMKNSLKKGIAAETADQAGKIGIKEGLLKTASDIDNLAVITSKSLFGNRLKGVVPNILTEGVFEEGGQFGMSEAISKYFKDKYNNKIKGDLN